jgi:MinD-like ATPase involved in chromosome partitioning or flagellar assembly
MVSNVVRQLATTTKWGELDYLILDLPPGVCVCVCVCACVFVCVCMCVCVLDYLILDLPPGQTIPIHHLNTPATPLEHYYNIIIVTVYLDTAFQTSYAVTLFDIINFTVEHHHRYSLN